MEQTMEILRRRLRQLNNDLVRITEILALCPDSLTKLRPKLRAVSEALKDIHSTLDGLEPEYPPSKTIRRARSK
jgi:predicted  nucleic acid-binding Zn-ribbon protein